MAKTLAFHSYKGGTGKTTLASNLAAMLCSRGQNVALLDLDVYAPSLHAYFETAPQMWLNDILSEEVQLKDVMVDKTKVIQELCPHSNKIGKLWIAFSNPQKEEVFRLEGSRKEEGKMELLRRLINFKDDLISDYECDFVIIDTSPGIRPWAINSLAIADILFLTLKFGELDIDGTRRIASEIYSHFRKFGAQPYLLLNRVAGYCVPNTLVMPHSDRGESSLTLPQFGQHEIASSLAKDVSMTVISAIPCYCDIQFTTREFLTVLQYPNHPFAKQLEELIGIELFKD